ncbi:hypothetical protein [Candidatus Galacturonibacter soehngenii]|uniref:Uncharacterized protein n=1 Tax=Candidatus Galacturonatibacter soehngenii TaxID=2307010 RepID=A0A7V7QJ45_9FIRM|nr:hypothetical protein [Candidatus Galacturonibacter soehngenii]KAB1437560.1 hypothetical protein F7O84_08100 [Candidatus Galacturonibacter soehngenii]
MIYGVYPSFLDCGYAPSLFWNSSLEEIIDLIQSYNRREEQRVKEEDTKIKTQISLNWVLAQQIGEHLGMAMGNRTSLTPLYDYFPELFKSEKEEADRRAQMNQLELNKARMEDYAYQHNERRKRERGEG